MERRNFVSLNLLGDSSSYLAYNFEGKDTIFSEKARGIIKNIIENELTPNQKELIDDYYYKGKSITEIARMRGVNKSSISRSMKSARERIGRSLRYGTFRLWEEA